MFCQKLMAAGCLVLSFVPQLISAQMLTPEIVFSDQSAVLPAGQTWQYGNGDTYRGKWVEGKPHGVGVYWKANGDVYRGQFDHGYMHGEGNYSFRFGDVYEGEFQFGKIQGYGEMKYQNGNVYTGEWREGVRHGKGKLQYPSGTSYDGTWIRGEKGGHGLMVYSNGDRYIGAYLEGRPHGHGVLTLESGEIYRGTFSRGVPHGVGECSLPEASTRVCLFERGDEIQQSEKLELAKNYLDKHSGGRTFKGGIAYQLQDEFTNDRYYLKTKNVWWEKERAIWNTQLRINSKQDGQYLYLIVNQYKGPGVYQLKSKDIMASTPDGEEIQLPKDSTAVLEIQADKDGEISGSFSVPALASKKGDSAFSIVGGRFEAGEEPPADEQPIRPYFYIH